MRTLALASALAVAVSSAGSAALAAKAPDPDRRADQPPLCNDGKGGVVVDGLMATMLGVGTLAAGSAGEGSAAALLGLATLTYAISAASGNTSASKCQAANDEYAAYLEGERTQTIGARQVGGGIGGLPFDPEEEDQGVPIVRAPTPVVVAPRPAPPIPTPAPRPVPPPPSTGDTSDDTSDDAGSAGADVDVDDSAWSDFWQEVPR